MTTLPQTPETRRRVLLGFAASVSVFSLGALALPGTALAVSVPPQDVYVPTFFDAAQWRTLHALADRLIPSSAEGPGALETGVPEFIDRQMNTPYGHGSVWYLHGPTRLRAPEFGYQLTLTPRDLYLQGLPAFDKAVGGFAALAPAAQDAAITQMQGGKLAMGDIPSDAFFNQLLANVKEGYFSDPIYGGNKRMAAWRMIGFPGARGDYMDWVEQYGRKYPFQPVSIA